MNEKDILKKNYGPWGEIRKKDLYENRPAEWEIIEVAGNLDQYLEEYNDRLQVRADSMLDDMMKAAGVDESLKERDPMAWIGQTNAIKAQVHEILEREILMQDVKEGINGNG